NQNMLALIIFLVLGCALATERIGTSGFFGAFMLGVIVPKNPQFIRQLGEKLEDFVVVFLLPLFLAWVGLSTNITLLNTPAMWGFGLLVVLIACAGKIGAAVLTGRLLKIPPRDSAAIGIVLNTR